MINRIAVRNFRSLRNIELDLGPLTVLVGPNGTGKSNLIDVLRFVDSFAWKANELEEEVDARGGWHELIWGGQRDSDLEVNVEFARESAYSVTLRTPVDGGTVADAESLSVNGGSPLVERRGGTVLLRGTDVGHMDGRHSVVTLVSSSDPPSEPLGWRHLLQPELPKWRSPDWSFYDLIPGETRGPKPITRAYRLDIAGSNLATVVHTLFSDGHPALDDALDFLRGCVPTVERLVSPIFGEGQTYVALAERGVPHPVGSWGLSDGTLLALAIAVALVTPKPPDLICLESPEAGIHPRMLEAIADLLKSASAETQVIVTTHSPYLLRWLPHDDFVVVEKTEGATALRPLRGDQDIRELVEELGAGEAWYAGYLGGVP